ncbi:MAG: nuclear transport factor 2 family protein, partial [Calditrichaeota bacterium]|nr:nuclear transport factor 2 family protein [Calditrichota bacterium]
PTLRKYGYWFNPRTNNWSDGSEMNYKQLVKLAETWNTDNRNVDPKSGKKEITILDQLDKTASAKLVAHWGVDYFHLSKEDGKWKIVNVIWQSPPRDN